MRGERLDIQTADGVLDCHLFEPGGIGAWPMVVLYMDAFGIRPELDSMADRLASQGVVVAVPNLYYRSGTVAPFDTSAVFTDGPERDRFKGLIASISNTMVMQDTAAVLERISARPTVRDGPTAAVGYCMGGGFALSAAGSFPDRVVAAASDHGGSLATDKPDSPHLLAPRMRARVYVGVADIDPSFNATQEQRLRTALEAGGVRFTIERYVGAKHGFAVTGHPVFDHAAAERHWQSLSQLLHDTLL
jgi:carboxymethylenebutenolidase